MKTKERKWQDCRTCSNLAELRSHPWIDGKPITNISGFVCLLPFTMSKKNFVMKASPYNIQCECWEKKIDFKKIEKRIWRHFKHHKKFYFSDVAEALNINLEVAVDVCKEMMRKGVLESRTNPVGLKRRKR